MLRLLCLVFLATAVSLHAKQAAVGRLVLPAQGTPEAVAEFVAQVRQVIVDRGASKNGPRTQRINEVLYAGFTGSPLEYEDRDVIAKLAPLLPVHVDALLVETGKVAPDCSATDAIFARSVFAAIRKHPNWSREDRARIYQHLATAPLTLGYVIVPLNWAREAEPEIVAAAHRIKSNHSGFAGVLVQFASRDAQVALRQLLTETDANVRREVLVVLHAGAKAGVRRALLSLADHLDAPSLTESARSEAVLVLSELLAAGLVGEAAIVGYVKARASVLKFNETTKMYEDPTAPLKLAEPEEVNARAGGEWESPRWLAPPPQPDYPADLKDKIIQGYVEIEFVVGTKGEVTEAKAFKASHEGFIESAIASVRTLKFRPGRLDGKPRVTRMRLPMHFRIYEEGP